MYWFDSDRICKFKENSFSKDFGTSTFVKAKLPLLLNKNHTIKVVVDSNKRVQMVKSKLNYPVSRYLRIKFIGLEGDYNRLSDSTKNNLNIIGGQQIIITC